METPLTTPKLPITIAKSCAPWRKAMITWRRCGGIGAHHARAQGLSNESGRPSARGMKRWWAVLVLFWAACVNPYARFYQGLADARQKPNYVDSQEDLQLYSSDNFERDRLALMRRGYMPIGQASFNAAADGASEQQLREQARKVGARVVLVASRYTHTISGAVPLQVPYTATSRSSGSATAYGGGGSVQVYANEATTTSGTRTVMMPYLLTALISMRSSLPRRKGAWALSRSRWMTIPAGVFKQTPD